MHPTAVHVRRASAEDAGEIHAVMLAAFTPFRRHYTAAAFDATVLDPRRIRRRMDEGPVWVEGAPGRVAATVSARLGPDGVYVRGLGVHPDARRRGAGRLLLETVEKHAVRVGARRMWLSTTPFLDASITLYRSCGFVPCHGPDDLEGTPLQTFEKRLDGEGRDACAPRSDRK